MSDHTWSIVNRLGHPYLVKNIECLEKIQRRATKMGRGLDDLCYVNLYSPHWAAQNSKSQKQQSE